MIGTDISIGFNPKSQIPDIDERKYNNGVPWASAAEFLANVPEISRAHYLEANIAGLWYYLDSDLVTFILKGGYIEPIRFTFNDIEDMIDSEYVLDLDSEPCTITGLSIMCDSGTCDSEVKIDGVSVTGLSANGVATTRQRLTATGLNIVSNGGVISIAFTNLSGATGVTGKLFRS